MKPLNKNFIISVSFANYLRDKTGMPKVMLEHQQMYLDAGISYIGLFSVKKNLLKDNVMLFCKFGLIIDGEFLGIFQMSQLIELFAKWCQNGHTLSAIHIHHLLYINLHRVEELLRAFPDTPIQVFLHDYYNACVNHNLMKSQKEFCGGQGLTPEYCGGCPSFKKSIRVQSKLHDMYKEFLKRITFISPSQITKDIFLNFHPEYANQVLVFPHEVFTCRTGGPLSELSESQKINVAYLGMPAYHKGWDAWKKLVSSADSSQYCFTVFNSTNDAYPGMDHVKVAFSSEHINAMTDALKEKQIHIAVLWSMCPETYSYTCFEAFAANAMLITRQGSGNIAGTVSYYNCGLVLDDEETLIKLFQDPLHLRQLLNDYRNQYPGGPEEMIKNTQIVEFTKHHQDLKTNCKPKKKPVNYPLLFLLNYFYRHGKI